jgi:hypothetical protein
MRRPLVLGTILALLAPVAAPAQQSALGLNVDQSLELHVPGATSAYSVNPLIAQASAADGVVHVRGVGAGATTVVVVTASGATAYSVTVTSPQLAAALGERGSPAEASQANETEGGSYEGRYDSGAGQVSNTLAFSQQEGHVQRRFTLVTATYVSPQSGAHGTGIPLLSYEVKRPGRDVVYLDESVTTSPLTFSQALVRGIHVVQGDWTFHAGASSVALFGPYFIPTNPQWVAGVTRDVPLSRSGDVAANLYDVIDTPGVEPQAPGGLIGSLLFHYHPQPQFHALAEVGLSRALGFAFDSEYDDDRQHFDASLLDKPASFATLASQAQQGLFGTVDYDRTIGQALTLDASGQLSNYRLPAFRENSLTGQSSVIYRLSRAWSVTAQALYSSFASVFPVAFNLRTLSLPVALDFSSPHFTAGVQDAPTSDLSGTNANGYGANLGISQGRFQINGFYNHNVQIPTLTSIFSQVPGLQAALEQAGINVTDPAQLAALLNNAALLASLGFAGLKLDVAPVSDTTGMNALWTLPGAIGGQHASLTYLDSASQLVRGNFGFRLATLAYVRSLNGGNQIGASLGMLQTAAAAPAGAAPGSRQITYGVSFRHRFGSVPELLFPVRRGTIQGYVFADEEASGRYSSGDPGIGGVTVVLDGERSVRTDATGHYVFTGVPFGSHQVAAQIAGTKPYYFTTPSPASATIGSVVDFGVSFVAGRIFGYVTDDTGRGIGGVVVRVAGLDAHATTEDDGRFVIAGVPNGRYLIAPDAASFPAGYDLSAIAPVRADVTAGAPWPVRITVRALRSVSGTVTYYNPRTGRLRPAAGAVVSIPQLGLSVTTDADGDYTLRDLLAGSYTIETGAQRRTIVVPPEPSVQTHVDFRVTVGELQRMRRLRRWR